MEKKQPMDIFNFDNINPEKQYTVIIKNDPLAKDGYEFFAPDEYDGPKDKGICEVSYYFKAKQGQHNPTMVIKNITGDQFEGRRKMLRNFEKHFALKYSVEIDGFYKNI